MLDAVEKQICFAAICETGSITAAAALLNRSKGHISKQLTQFEREIGTRLFHRTTRRMDVTVAGEALRPDALQLLRQSMIMLQKARDLDSQLIGRFVMTAPASIGLMLLTPFLPQLHSTFPGIQFELRITNQNLDLVREGIDLGFRCGDVLDESLVARPLGTSQEVVCASRKYLSQAGPLEKPEDLMHHMLLLNPFSLTQGELSLTNGGAEWGFRPNTFQSADHFAIISEWVGLGLGVGVIPDYSFKKIEPQSDVIRVLPPWHGKALPFWMIHPFQVPLPHKLKMVSPVLREFLQKSINLPDPG